MRADLGDARVALTSPDPAIARAAGEALLDLVVRGAPASEPLLSRESLSPAATRNLALPLARRLEDAPAGAVPACIYRLGEGIVPCLALICRHPRFTPPRWPVRRVHSIRERALYALARIGGDDARSVLGAMARTIDPRRSSTWWKAINEVGPGKGLLPVHELTAELAQRSLNHRHRQGVIPLGGRDQIEYYRFLATHPAPPELDPHRIETVQRVLDSALEMAGRRRFPSWLPAITIEMVRAHVVRCEPDEFTLEMMVRASRPARPTHRGTKRRAEEFGTILTVVEPYKEHPAVAEALTELLEDDALAVAEGDEKHTLPNSVRAWAHFLEGKTEKPRLERLATELIRAGGGAATLTQRRLGARLWLRLGTPPLELVRSLLTDVDPWMRGCALRWARKAADRGELTPEAWSAAIGRALAEEDASVLLLAAETAREPLARGVRDRLLDLAVEGRRSLRGRAWRVLARAASRASAEDEPFDPPPASAALDERIRAAATLGGSWRRRRRLRPL